MERSNLSEKFPLGTKLPSFSLPNVDGRDVGDSYLRQAKLALVVFTCNHCPYVKGTEAFLIDLVKKYETKGLKTIAISSNDAIQYPEDSFEKMKEKAKSQNLPYPYLYDESQNIAKLFDAACTPECYLFDQSNALIYHGAINNSPKDPTKATDAFLAKALEQASAGQKPNPGFVNPMGCSIKWKQ